MKIRTHEPTTHERWANLRFSVVGHLLAAPPPRGDLQRELERLATTAWRHPITSAPTRFGLSTIERWYYEAKNAPTDPVGRLRKKLRKDLGRRVAITDVLVQAIHAQYDARASTWRRSRSASSTITRGSRVTCSGTSPRTPRTSCTVSSRRSTNAASRGR